MYYLFTYQSRVYPFRLTSFLSVLDQLIAAQHGIFATKMARGYIFWDERSGDITLCGRFRCSFSKNYQSSSLYYSLSVNRVILPRLTARSHNYPVCCSSVAYVNIVLLTGLVVICGVCKYCSINRSSGHLWRVYNYCPTYC